MTDVNSQETTMSNLTTVLKATREKISTPDRWTQNAYARNAKGETEQPSSPGAVCWCLVGALRSVLPDMSLFYVENHWAYIFLAQEIPVGNAHHPASFNDNSTHAEVLAFLDRVIQLAERDQ